MRRQLLEIGKSLMVRTCHTQKMAQEGASSLCGDEFLYKMKLAYILNDLLQ